MLSNSEGNTKPLVLGSDDVSPDLLTPHIQRLVPRTITFPISEGTHPDVDRHGSARSLSVHAGDKITHIAKSLNKGKSLQSRWLN